MITSVLSTQGARKHRANIPPAQKTQQTVFSFGMTASDSNVKGTTTPAAVPLPPSPNDPHSEIGDTTVYPALICDLDE